VLAHSDAALEALVRQPELSDVVAPHARRLATERGTRC
jgi:hypothetical protein